MMFIGEKIMRVRGIRTLIAIVSLGIILISCSQTRIADITADPGSFKNKEVTVAGEVVQAVGASVGPFSEGVYEISDGTGSLWIYSDKRGVPTKGAHVGVRGRVAESITVMGRNYGTVLRESDRRIVKAEH
jgi:hypothetical protein